MAVAVGIAEVTRILATLLVGVCDRNANHLAVHIGKHHRAFGLSSLPASQKRHDDGYIGQQDSCHVSPL